MDSQLMPPNNPIVFTTLSLNQNAHVLFIVTAYLTITLNDKKYRYQINKKAPWHTSGCAEANRML